MLDIARAGDSIVVWRLDRLGRSLKDLIETVGLLEERKIELRSLKESIDTCAPDRETAVSHRRRNGRV